MRRHRRTWIWMGGVLALALAAGPAWSGADTLSPAREQAKSLSKAFVEVAAEIKPAVVHIRSERYVNVSHDFGPLFRGSPFGEEFFRRFFDAPDRGSAPDRKFKQSGAGSGVVVDGRGHILTNNHVVAGAEKLKVYTSDGNKYDATIVGRDPRTDLAVIRVENASLPYAKLGDSDRIETGEWVLAVGSPFGLPQTVTAGIVSAKGRNSLSIADYEDWIQTDADINPGNSGGPLVNLDGQVVGINSAIMTRSGASAGVGFAVPANLARSIMNQIIEHGKVTRGYMGVYIQPLTPELAERFGLEDTRGALIGKVIPDSPAEKAGFRVGDVVLRYDGKPVKDSGHLRLMVAGTPVGKKVKVDLIRDGKDKTLTLVPAELTEDRVTSAETGEDEPTGQAHGMTLQDLTEDVARRLGYDRTHGVVVTAVEPDSPADEAGIRAGDLIVEVERQKIRSVSDFQKKIRSLGANSQPLLLVQTRQGARFVVLTLE